MVFALAGLCLGAAGTANAVSIDLSSWTAESYPAVNEFGGGQWDVSASQTSVTQIINSGPTIFYSDFDFSTLNSEVIGVLDVTFGDDDMVGFVLGFEPGDTTSTSADYLLIDWKGRNQTFDFPDQDGLPSTPAGTALRGLAVSRVVGIPTADEFWGHEDFAENAQGGVTELARAANLGLVGWSPGSTYAFQLVLTSTQLQVFVDGSLEISLDGSFEDGRVGFYNFSEDGAIYSAQVVPEPGTAVLIGLGLLGLGIGRRRA